MKTFIEFVAEQSVDEGLFDFLKKKKPAAAKPAPKFKPHKQKDSPHYRTDHHYGYGDIDPQTVPVFKPSWQTAGR